MQLPIDTVLPDLRAALRASRQVILSAPPGAGKTTCVPAALLGEDWLSGGRIVMLEPRRLAARRAAEFMASTAGERVGETVGYRIRGESRVGPKTRIEVVTEGILTRVLQDDPALTGTGAVIFDEFHERSLTGDLGLALALDAQNHLRPDLRILVMSATLDGTPLARLLSDAPIVEGKGNVHPVETRYASFRSDRPVEVRVVDSIRRAMQSGEGDILVFLPGRREIVRVESLLYEKALPGDPIVHLLYGDAGYERQLAALVPDPQGGRKVILSTSIAETSLTIDGVRIVIDAGLARSATFDPRRGMSGLVTGPVSRAIADQRRGRAGRQGPGLCFRLWTREDHERLPPFPTPEILAADLAPLALDLTLWGNPLGEGLRFLDPPPLPHLSQARDLLRTLGALDAVGHFTSHGRLMTQLPVHPRLAHMMLRGRDLGCGGIACDIAALLEERDLFSGSKGPDIDLRSRWAALRNAREADRGARDRINAQAGRFRSLLGVTVGTAAQADRSIGMLLGFAYPERLARQREKNSRRYQMASGTGAILPEGSLLAREQYLALGEVDGAGAEVKVFLAAPIDQSDLESAFSAEISTEDEIRWDSRSRSVIARRARHLGSIMIKETLLRPEGDQALSSMLEGIREMGIVSLPWTGSAGEFRTRSEWLRTSGNAPAGWPDLSDEALLSTLPRWLGPFLGGISKQEHLSRVDLSAALRGLFSRQQLHEIDRLAPSHLKVPGGSQVRIDYTAGAQPVLAVRLQEMFGETDTPRVAGGKVPLLLQLLSPARRPLAVTQDLRSFWANSYQGFRKQMQARYPRHNWPEDPLAAVPTNRVTKRVVRKTKR
jgi:ATP-dependent helicase HrpB